MKTIKPMLRRLLLSLLLASAAVTALNGPGAPRPAHAEDDGGGDHDGGGGGGGGSGGGGESEGGGDSGGGDSGGGESGGGGSEGGDGGSHSRGGDDSGGDGGGEGSATGTTGRPAGEASDQDPQVFDQLLARMLKGKIAPIPEIQTLARRAVPGEVVNIRLNREGLRYLYKVSIVVDSGDLFDVWIDASTRDFVSVRQR